MSFNLNRVELIGRLGRDPEMRYTGDGQAVSSFSLATDRPARAGAKPETDWHHVVCWAKLGEFAGQYLTKGRMVFVAGRLTYRSWEGKDGKMRHTTEVVASELIPLDRRPDAEPAEGSPVPEEDEIPF
jgi:single-strand DNA-binding protein